MRTFSFDNSQTCTSSGSQFFCLLSGGSDASTLNGCDLVTFYTTSSYYYSTTTFKTSTPYTNYIPTATTCAMYKGRGVCVTDYSSSTTSLPMIITESLFRTHTLTLPMIIQTTFDTSIFVMTVLTYMNGHEVKELSEFTWIQTEYFYTPVPVDSQKLSW